MTEFKCTEHSVTSWDGVTLFYRAWIPSKSFDKALFLFHRGHEHSGRLQDLAEELNLENAAIFAWDARGNGRSPGERDYADHFSCYVKDADTFVNYICTLYNIPMGQVVVLGHSVGAVIVATWVHDYAPRIRAMILATPAFRIRLYLPLAIPLLRLARKLKLMKFVPSYVQAKVLTHDPQQIKKYAEDKLITHSIAVNILLDLHDTATRMMEDAGTIQIPTLLLTAGADWVVSLSAERCFFERLGSTQKEIEHYPAFYHAIFHEQDRHLPQVRIQEFIRKVFEQNLTVGALRYADRESLSQAKYDRLCQPPSWHSWRGLCFFPVKVLLNSLGRLSQGIRLGWSAGFNSGRMLDYVYENRPRGFTFLGKLIDWGYLNSIGWKGIRQRKLIMERLLKNTLEKVCTMKGSVQLVDIAAGAGRYLLETLQSVPHLQIFATLRDFDTKSLEEGHRLAEELNLTNVTFVTGDAFDRFALASLMPKPQVAVVSGLYELFPDNERILNSLRGLADAMESGGFLIYTNQPWHPQLEMIARTLCDWDGKPWIMRCRSQAEMDELVRVAGFDKIDMDIDDYGIFTVSVARRRDCHDELPA